MTLQHSNAFDGILLSLSVLKFLFNTFYISTEVKGMACCLFLVFTCLVNYEFVCSCLSQSLTLQHLSNPTSQEVCLWWGKQHSATFTALCQMCQKKQGCFSYSETTPTLAGLEVLLSFWL